MDTSELASVVHELTTTLEREANVRAVFGEPIKLDTRTVIPVASIALGGGLGGVRALGSAVETVRRWLSHGPTSVTPARTLAGGGGGGIEVRPVGFLCEEGGRVVFTAIDVPHHHRPHGE